MKYITDQWSVTPLQFVPMPSTNKNSPVVDHDMRLEGFLLKVQAFVFSLCWTLLMSEIMAHTWVNVNNMSN